VHPINPIRTHTHTRMVNAEELEFLAHAKKRIDMEHTFIGIFNEMQLNGST
jgi:hypothetical protein